jgi:uncharacterized membrane protein
MSARSWIGWGLATVVIAVLAHMASMHFAPRFIMHIAMHRMGAVNAIHHQPRTTAASQLVVRPSPDLLYSVCPFDLKDGPLLVTATVPQGTYWSVSVFDADTNNIFALNDRQASAKTIALILLPSGSQPSANTRGGAWIKGDPGTIRFASATPPTNRGLVLFRTLISDEKDFAKIDAVRRKANCKLLGKS